MTAALEHWKARRMDPETAEELALVERVTSGDEDALRTLYHRYAEPLFAYVCHCLDGARPDAEEVWQDALAGAIRTLNAYRGESRFFSWLCSIARHKLADHFRRQSRIRQTLFLVPPEDLTRLIDSGPLPDEIINQRAICLRVVEVLGQLPADYRSALVARYAEGRSVEEVAQLLDRGYKATESLLSRARDAFRAALACQTEIDL